MPSLLETEKPLGHPNAATLLLEIDWPALGEMAAHLKVFEWPIARRFELDPEAVKRGFRDYQALASSQTVDAVELPVKIYGRYLPEITASAECALFGNEIDGGLLGGFCLNLDCPKQSCVTKPPVENRAQPF